MKRKIILSLIISTVIIGASFAIPSNRPVIPWNDYIEYRFNSLERYIDSRFDSIEKEKATALASMKERLDGMNEFRASLKDQNSTFIPRAEYLADKISQDTQIQELKTFKAVADSKASQIQMYITMGIAIISAVFSVVAYFKKKSC